MIPKAIIVGIDEAGRGALAGPVVPGACLLIKSLRNNERIQDSKQLTEKQREEAYEWIVAHCTWGIGIVEAAYIDQYGILAATEKAMQEALALIEKSVMPTYLLVDGRDRFWFNYPHSAVIRGDETEPCISAASILAKVTRDRLMLGYAKTHPYGFEEHKGYGTAGHFAAIQERGLSPLHRRTFLKNITAAPLSTAPRPRAQ
ncbi:MAG: Ribonuclease HII [Candidatus Peribacteria bacterium GW2011_GWB1_54_5]|nr:MAG: Ribonuclease HII [Candidatus Peribacteria bacterium GW2011_GWB1_54_5]